MGTFLLSYKGTFSKSRDTHPFFKKFHALDAQYVIKHSSHELKELDPFC